jgi:ribonuclease HI
VFAATEPAAAGPGHAKASPRTPQRQPRAAAVAARQTIAVAAAGPSREVQRCGLHSQLKQYRELEQLVEQQAEEVSIAQHGGTASATNCT